MNGDGHDDPSGDGRVDEKALKLRSMRSPSRRITPHVLLPSSEGLRSGAPKRRPGTKRAASRRDLRGPPEVIIKIYSSCRGMTPIGRHLNYISRNGRIDLEDQDGFILRGTDQLKTLKADWRVSGQDELSSTSERRDALNIVFSMPADTDETALRRAVRLAAKKMFEGHDYVFAYHTPSTDPDPSPPAHPHVHLLVKTLSLSGRRLNPRKPDLRRWREGFAEHLRMQGVAARATRRMDRPARERDGHGRDHDDR